MRSSTSSSDVFNAEARVPAGPWGRTWAIAALLFVAAVTLFEFVARAHGHRPSVADDPDLWVYWRKRIYDGKTRSVVLLGGSRLALAFSRATFERMTEDYSLTQLSVSGTQPIAALRDLADDSQFRGVAICDVTEHSMERRYWPSQEYLVSAYHAGQPLDFEWNVRASIALQERLTIMNPFLDVPKLAFVAVTTGTFRGPYHVTGYSDRSQLADFSRIADLVDFQAAQRRRVLSLEDPPSPPDEWLAGAREIADMAERIASRGGKVVFLYMPQGSTQAGVSRRRYPRAEYWDRFAQAAAPHAEVIHYEDYPQLSNLDVPDEAHLDAKDVPRFTRALIEALIRRGALS